MKKNYKSFETYIEDKYYQDMHQAIKKFIHNKGSSLDLNHYHVIDPSYIDLQDIVVKGITFYGIEHRQIFFNAAIKAEIILKGMGKTNYKADVRSKWFIISFYGHLISGLRKVMIIDVREYSKKRFSKENALSKYLVPYLYLEDLDKEAAKFLQRYYPEALEKPMPIDTDELLDNMCLTMYYAPLPDGTFGKSYFGESQEEVFEEDLVTIRVENIGAGTILVNPNVCFMRNIGSVKNTIIHECIHHELHSNFFELQKLLNSDVSVIGCEAVDEYRGNTEGVNEAVQWMEWQANTLAPRIQMPLAMFKTKASEFIKQYRTELGKFDLIDVMEPVIDALATFFCVSRLAAKIRMIDAGHEEAIGTFNYIDGRYVKPHRFKKGALQRNQTFSISVRDAAILSTADNTMRSLVKDGSYQYVDSHFVLNHPKYLTQGLSGETILTNYARNHMDECCLIFDLSVKAVYKEKYYNECFLNRDSSSNIIFEAKFADNNKENISQSEMIKKYNKDLLDVAMRLPMSLAGTVDALIKWSEMTEEDLAWESQLSEKTIQRLRNGEPDNVTIDTIVQLCIGMRLPPVLSNYLVRNSGNSFMMTEQHMMYQFILNSCYTKSLDECNEMLLAQNLKLLGKKNRLKKTS